MITEINMYWLTRLDGICMACGILTFLAAVVMGLCWIMYVAAKMDGIAEAGIIRNIAYIGSILFVLGTAGVLFIPTTKEMAAIYAIPAIARSETIQKDIPELYEAGMEYIKYKVKTGD